MRRLLLLGLLALVLARPRQEMQLLIDSAPSVVSYQGSSQTHTRFVIAPMGRALGYVEPTNVNRTFHTHPNESNYSAGHELFQPRPVYVP
ncbi:uncharacterized protein [Drosophila virilis]|uniref:Uncharacterized protein n=1 Tax=Drosophila virilis TaxID=7244 RepID=B4LI21_DROVI|nr:uncharacterized protein LOC6623606 [Drosophila virilis]EDW68565.1 uncharacterized protein Dvir_GJ12628 [Drosophila virilis]